MVAMVVGGPGEGKGEGVWRAYHHWRLRLCSSLGRRALVALDVALVALALAMIPLVTSRVLLDLGHQDLDLLGLDGLVRHSSYVHVFAFWLIWISDFLMRCSVQPWVMKKGLRKLHF